MDIPIPVRESEPSQETASLVKRLAGPSTTKAGLVQDQSGINRVIAEASKGSKFYENEKKKDKELTEKIARILKYRDEVLRGVDIHKIEHAVDQQLRELELARDLSQVIVHVDMDAFYANVELLDHPELKGKPFGVGGGVLTTASYEARKFGVRSGMPGFIAKKLCPDIVLVKLRFSRYIEMSNMVMDVFRRYDPNMCPAGTDEGYLNITAYCQEHDLSPDECVQEMRATVNEETKLTVSAGIAPNKMLAKICSDMNKPNGQFQLPFNDNDIKAFMRDLSIRKIPGVGRVNERLLESVGIKTCGDIYAERATLSLMQQQFGLTFLLRTYLGIASNVVQPLRREERKSIGYERTFNPTSDKAAILRKLEECAKGLEDDMERSGWTGKTVTLKYKLDTYQVFTRAKSFDRWITKNEELFETGKELLEPEWPLKIRLIGLRLTKLKDLRAPVSNSGIKRFFDSVHAPHKRPKFASLDDSEGTSAYYGEPDAVSDIETESMPNFHEHEEEDEIFEDLMRANADDDSDLEDEGMLIQPPKGKVKPRPPISAPAPQLRKKTADNAGPSNLSRSKPKSHSAAQYPLLNPSLLPCANTQNGIQGGPDENEFPTANKVRVSEQSAQTCPVCFKSLVLDNQGFNAHVDFCLSREAIKEAQLEAVGSSVKETGHRQSMWLGKQGAGARKEGEQNSNFGTKRRT